MTVEWVAGPLVAAAMLTPLLHADDPGLEVSRDGRTWSSTVTGPLLDDDVRLAPGGATRSDLWVRNASDDTVTMTAVVRDSRTTLPEEVAPRDDFRARIGDTEVVGAQLSGCRVVARETLAPRERHRLPVTVRLPAGSGNVSQRQSITLSLRVALVAGESQDSCAGGSDGANPAMPPEKPGRVATDGGLLERSVMTDVLALALVVAGVSVLVRRRPVTGWFSRRVRARRGPRAS